MDSKNAAVPKCLRTRILCGKYSRTIDKVDKARIRKQIREFLFVFVIVFYFCDTVQYGWPLNRWPTDIT